MTSTMTEQDSKQQILAAATAVFAQKGFAKASMNDIVRQSGMSKGGVYWHFKSKDAIVEAIFEQFFTTQLMMLDAILTGNRNASDKLMQLAQLLGQDLEQVAEQFPTPLEFYAQAARNETLTERLQVYFQAFDEQFVTLVKQGVAAGEFADVPAKETATTLGALFEGILLMWSINPERFELGIQVETAVTLLLNGIRKQDIK